MKKYFILAIVVLCSCTTSKIFWEPVITMSDEVYTFDKLPAAFEFSISPWQGDGTNIVEGRIIDNNGSNVSGIEIIATDQLKGNDVNKNVPGGEKHFRATAKSALSPGDYTIAIDHKLSGKQISKKAKLVVYKTSLTPESERTLKNTVGYLAIFGKTMAITNAVPTSGFKINGEQFRTYISTDIDQQKLPYIGYSVNFDNGVYLSCKAKTVSLRLTWIQPYTNQEVDILPEMSLDIRQEKPRINTMDKQDNVSQSGNRVRVTARDIRVGKPNDGQDRTSLADVEVKAGKATLETRLQGIVDVVSEPIIEMDGDLYNVTLELSVNLPKGTDMINGIVRVPIRAKATNRCADVQSGWEEKTISISFKYEQEGSKKKVKKVIINQKELRKKYSSYLEDKSGKVFIYKINDIYQIQRALQQENNGEDLKKSLPTKLDEATKLIIKEGVVGGSSTDEIKNEIENQGLPVPDQKIFTEAYNDYKMQIAESETAKSAFIISQKELNEANANDYLSIMISYGGSEFIDAYSNIGSDKIRFLNKKDLKSIKLNPKWFISDSFDGVIFELIRAGSIKKEM